MLAARGVRDRRGDLLPPARRRRRRTACSAISARSTSTPLKVLETIELASRYLDEVFENVTDEQIRANEADYNRAPRDAHRHAAAARRHLDRSTPTAIRWCPARCSRSRASSICRTATISASTRTTRCSGLYVGDVVTARATNERGQPRFFALSRKRIGPDGSFAGVMVISISPDYFRDYYATLTQPVVAALIRARRRGAGALSRAAARRSRGFRRGGPFMHALRRGQRVRHASRPSSALDGKERIFAFRKLPRIAVYVDRRRRYRGHHRRRGWPAWRAISSSAFRRPPR